MKTISDQLKDLGLKHGDLCEIEGVEGRCVVICRLGFLVAETDKVIYSYNDTNYKVTCGWKAVKPEFTEFCLYTAYTKVLPAPIPKPLPEAVEQGLVKKYEAYKSACDRSSCDTKNTLKYVDESKDAERILFSALLAEVERMIEAKLK